MSDKEKVDEEQVIEQMDKEEYKSVLHVLDKTFTRPYVEQYRYSSDMSKVMTPEQAADYEERKKAQEKE